MGQPSSLVNNLPRLCWFGIFLSFDSPTVKEMPVLARKERGKIAWLWKGKAKLEVFDVN